MGRLDLTRLDLTHLSLTHLDLTHLDLSLGVERVFPYLLVNTVLRTDQ
jgi:hypothetical protein